jgi:hypothetical protein
MIIPPGQVVSRLNARMPVVTHKNSNQADHRLAAKSEFMPGGWMLIFA